MPARCALALLAGMLWWGSASAQTAPTAPTRDQRALKVLAEARDLVAAGRPDESVPFYSHALDLAEAETDKPSVALANLLAEYGEVLRGAGLRARARVSLERSLQMLETLAGDDDPRLAESLLGLGRLGVDEDRCEAAKVVLARALGLLDAETQPTQVVSARVAQGRCAEAAGDQDAAFDHYRTAVVTAREASVETPDVATALHFGASILLAKGDAENAILFFRQCLSLRGRLLGEDDWRTAQTAMQLARALDREDQRPEAREIANQAARSLGRTCAPSSQAAADVRELCSELSLLRRSLVGERQTITETTPPRPPPLAAVATSPPLVEAPAAPKPGPPPPVDTPPAAWRVQISSQRSPAEAERVAEGARRTHAALLRAEPLLVYRVEVAGAIWHRVLFGAFDERDGAVALCEALKQAGMADCLPARSE